MLSGNKPDYIKDVHSPLENGKISSRELFSFKEKSDDPHKLVADVGLAVLDVQLHLALGLLLLL